MTYDLNSLLLPSHLPGDPKLSCSLPLRLNNGRTDARTLASTECGTRCYTGTRCYPVRICCAHTLSHRKRRSLARTHASYMGARTRPNIHKRTTRARANIHKQNKLRACIPHSHTHRTRASTSAHAHARNNSNARTQSATWACSSNRRFPALIFSYTGSHTRKHARTHARPHTPVSVCLCLPHSLLPFCRMRGTQERDTLRCCELG